MPRAQNAGSLAHEAVRDWIESGAWHRPDNARDELADCYQAAADRAGLQIGEILDGRLTGSRLCRRAAELGHLLSSYGTDAVITCEVPLEDRARRLRGRLDVLVTTATEQAVIDVKVGTDAAGLELPESLTIQMLIYAHLVRATHGQIPAQLAVFSLRTGARTLAFASAELDSLLARVDAARAAWCTGNRDARPAPGTCRFCARRMDCQPHWQALDAWDNHDAVEGTVLRLCTAANGHSAILLRTPQGDGWLVQVPASLLPRATLPVGTTIRAVRVGSQRRAQGTGHSLEWRATAFTMINAGARQ